MTGRSARRPKKSCNTTKSATCTSDKSSRTRSLAWSTYSAAYVPLKPDYWELYVIHDGDCTAETTKQLIDKIVKVEDLPSVPRLDPKITRASKTARMPDDAELIFEKG